MHMETPKETDGFVSLRGITKRYGKVNALEDVTFDIGEGEVFGYIGPNGAGKTTTIKILVGLISNFEGSLTIDGHPMPRERARVHELLGYMPQRVAFQEWRTVDQVLSTFGRLSGVPRDELDGRIQEALETVGLSDPRDKRISHLSGGNVQKVGLAQALLHKPRFLVLDEPLAGLDPAGRFLIKRVIREIGEAGTTVLFSSHILSDLQDIATRFGIISNGHILKVGTLDELKEAFDAPNVIEVDLFDTPQSVDGLMTLSGVDSVERPSPHRLSFTINNEVSIEEVTQRILRGLMEEGCRIKTYGEVAPNLDNLYNRYVGGALA